MDLFGSLSELEKPLFRFVNQAGANPVADALFLVLTLMGASYVLVWTASVAWLRGRKELAVDLLVALALATIAVEIGKFLFGRERPEYVLDNVKTVSIWGLTSASDFAFPSGHAARAFAVATLLSFGSRRSVALGALIMASLVGLSRIYFGLHWPSDVVVGALVGSLCSIAIHRAGRTCPRYVRARKLLVDYVTARFRVRGRQTGP